MTTAVVRNFPVKTPPGYKKLIADITRLYENARKALAEAYWQIGRRIVEVEQEGAVRARYGETLIENLSEDLSRALGSGFSARNLERMRNFYLEHRKSSAPTELTWTQHVELMTIRDVKMRVRLEQKAIREGLTSREIRALARAEYRAPAGHQNLSGPDGKAWLMPIKGKIGIYRITALENHLQWDKGFSAYRELSAGEVRKYKNGDFVKLNKGRLEKVPDGKPADLYTYEAGLVRVIDADTFWMKIWTAPPEWRKEKLRLRGMDAPELNTEEGRSAKRFVEALFKKSKKIRVTTTKPDKYHRYLSDVFLLMPDGKEIFLNNRLLETGRAWRTDRIPPSEWEKE